jgi:hypothetical protein
MKKIVLTLVLFLAMINFCFSITWWEKLLLPEFKGDLTTVDYKVVDSSDQEYVIEINGVLYILKK